MGKLFLCHPLITGYDDVTAYFDGIALGESDLLITNRFLVDAEKTDLHGIQVIWQEDYGTGEPTDRMLLRILNSISRPYDRVIGIGGGTVLDLAKLLCLEYDCPDEEAIQALMMKKAPAVKHCEVYLAPTTCGTGSEVTNVAVLLLESLEVKMGLANDALYAKEAALIPSLLKTLPYKPMILSAIDALIHASESYVSPRANLFTRSCSVSAVTKLLDGFVRIAEDKSNADKVREDFLYASTLAGIAFGNAGCGPVHAMSYPVGGKYHLPHGESNYEVFLPVFRYYDSLADKQPLEELKQLFAFCMNTEPAKALDELEKLLEKVYQRVSLTNLGADRDILSGFADDVWQKQQRLLGNAMQPFTRDTVFRIFTEA